MTIEECYIKMGANYQDVIKRLPSVSMIEKFALKFREDMSFQELEKALKSQKVYVQVIWNWLYNNLMQSKSNILKQLML